MTLFCIAHLAMLAMFTAAPGSASQPIFISTIEQLQKIGGDNASYPLNGYYVIEGNIDASATRYWNDNGTGGYYGFAPVGANSIHPFSGTLDGQGYAIRNLFINRGSAQYVGLFGYVSGELATISNVALDNATITGGSFTGALVGYNDNCLIKKCSSAGSVSANNYVGGLVGRSHASAPISISNCYSTSAVSGNGGVGGLVGYNDSTPISTSYSAGRVSGGESRVGGLIGFSMSTTASDCFWDYNTSGQTTSAGGIAKSTADMQKKSTFINAKWDFTIWGISDNQTYPFLLGSKNLHPEAKPDKYRTGRNIVLTVQPPGVLDNDSDPRGNSLTAINLSEPSHGSLAFKTDGSFTYTPDKDYFGTDNFTYMTLAGSDSTPAATVTLTVDKHTAPVAVTDNYTDNYTQNRTLVLTVPAPGVLHNDRDPNEPGAPNGYNLTVILAVGATAGPWHGTLELKEDGSFTYTPEDVFMGTDNFTYYAYDGALFSAPAHVFIEVTSYCPLVLLFGKDSSEVATLRRYRDEVLAASAAGRVGIRLYYSMAPLVTDALENSEGLQQMARKIINRALPGIRERLQQGQ